MIKIFSITLALISFNAFAQQSETMTVGNPDSENMLFIEQEQFVVPTPNQNPQIDVEGMSTDDVAVSPAPQLPAQMAPAPQNPMPESAETITQEDLEIDNLDSY